MHINNRQVISYLRLFLLSCLILLLIAGILLGDTEAAAARGEKLIIIPGATITTDTTWTLANSPYLVTGWVTVNAGATLTIEPGVIVKFSSNTGMNVFGALDVNGIAGSPVIITESRDDSAGGDTNGDGDATVPAPGGWNGMLIGDNANADFENAEIRYGGAVFWDGAHDWPHYGNLRKDGAGTLSLDHILVTKSLSCGMRLDGTSGVNIITDSTFSYNGGYGACLNDAADTVYFTGSTFTQNSPWSIATSLKSSGFSIPPDNILDRPIHVASGGMSVNSTWSRQVYVTYGFTVNAGYTLTFPAGAVLKFMNMSGLVVLGNLEVNGLDGLPVVFTEFRDDTAGGDSNGDGSATFPAPGAWTGMYVTDGANASLEYTEIRYGGGYFFNGERDDYHYGNLRKDGAGTLSLDHSVVTKSASCGVRFNGSSGVNTVSDSTFSFNGNYGACLLDAVDTISFSGSIFTQNNPWSIVTTPKSIGFSIPPDNILDKPIFISGGATLDASLSRQVYVSYGFSVNAGYTLTIPAGAVLKFMNMTGLVVLGNLEVNGLDGLPVIITEIRDDTAGGDSNGDGGDTTPVAGAWTGMYVTDGANASLEYAEIRYGGGYFFNGDRDDYHYGNLRKDGAGTLTLDHTMVTQSASCGVRFNGSNGVHTITNSTFSFNGNYGACLLDAINTIAFTGSIFAQNSPWSIYTTPKSSGFSIPPDNLLDKPIYVHGGDLGADTTWSRQVYITYGISVNTGYTLTIPAGAVLKFMNMSGITVFGTLDVNGTQELPAIITEYRDDSAGGDSNGDGSSTTPAPGAWTGLFILGGGYASFDYAEIRYGGGYFWNGERDACHYGNLRKDGPGTLYTDHLTSMYSGCAGLWLTSTVTQAEIVDSHFRNNNGWGVLFQSTGSNLLVEGTLIDHNAGGGLHINNPGGINEVDQNTIVANTGAGIQVTNESPALIGGTDANGNNLYGNTTIQLQNLNGTTSVNATHNWWGINPPFTSGISGLVDTTSPLSAPGVNAPVYLADIMLSGPNIPATAMVNDTIAYTLYFTNGGPREAYHLVFKASIPYPAELLTVSGSGWECSVDGNQLTCYMPYLAADGITEIMFSIRSAVPSPLSFDVSISQANNDPLPQNNELVIHTTILMHMLLPLVTK